MLRKTSGLATGTYEYGLQRLSVEHVNEAKEYYLYNGTGNVTQTTAENGSLFLRYTYDAFGNISSIRAPMTVDIDDLNRYTYNGEDYDYNTGLQYLRARYYSTGTGNFISQDTYLGSVLNGLSLNRYTYVGNSPTMYNDPSGHIWNWAAGAIVGAVVGATSAAIGSVVNYAVQKATAEDPSEVEFDWRGLGQGMLTGAVSGAVSGAVLAGTGSTSAAGAVGGFVSGAMNGTFSELNRISDLGPDATDEERDFNWGTVGCSTVTGTVSGAASGFVGGVSGSFTGALTGSNFAGALVGGTSASVVGGIVGRAIGRNPETRVFSSAAIFADATTGALSSIAGYGIYSTASRIEVGEFNVALQEIGKSVQDGLETKLANVLLSALANNHINAGCNDTDSVDDSADLSKYEYPNRSSKSPVSTDEWEAYLSEKYGAENVSRNINSIDDILNNPRVLRGYTDVEIAKILGDGWTRGSYGSNGQGWKFTKGDISVFYHAGGGRHVGAYYGVASGQVGKIKVVDPSTYVPTQDDNATVLYD